MLNETFTVILKHRALVILAISILPSVNQAVVCARVVAAKPMTLMMRKSRVSVKAIILILI